MRIHRLTAFQIPIALKKPVRYASHERRANETLILRCVMDDGSCGWGEGLPRPYVTGETIDSVWRHLELTDFAPLRDATFSSASNASLAIDDFRFADVAADPGIDVRECFGNSLCASQMSRENAASLVSRLATQVRSVRSFDRTMEPCSTRYMQYCACSRAKTHRGGDR